MPVAWPSLGKRETPLNLDWLLHFPVADDEFFFSNPLRRKLQPQNGNKKRNQIAEPLQVDRDRLTVTSRSIAITVRDLVTVTSRSFR
jgi:hypothetical protein